MLDVAVEPIGGKPLVSVMISETDLQHRPHQHESPTIWLNINSKKGYPSGKLSLFGKSLRIPVFNIASTP